MSDLMVETVFGMQRSGDTRSFGEIAVALGFVEDNSLNASPTTWTRTINPYHKTQAAIDQLVSPPGMHR